MAKEPRTYKDAIIISQKMLGNWLDLGLIAETNEDAEAPEYADKRYLWLANEIDEEEKIINEVILEVTPNQKIGYTDIFKYIIQNKLSNKKTYKITCRLVKEVSKDKYEPIYQADGLAAENWAVIRLNFTDKVIAKEAVDPNLILYDEKTHTVTKTYDDAFVLDTQEKEKQKLFPFLSGKAKEITKSIDWEIASLELIKGKEVEGKHTKLKNTKIGPIPYKELLDQFNEALYKKTYKIFAFLLDEKGNRIKNSDNEEVSHYFIVYIGPKTVATNSEVASPEGETPKTKEEDKSEENLKEENKNNKFVQEIIDQRTKVSSKNASNAVEINSIKSYGLFQRRKTNFLIIPVKEAKKEKDISYFWYAKEIDSEKNEIDERINIKYGKELTLPYNNLHDLLINKKLKNHTSYNLHVEPSTSTEVHKESIPVFLPISLNYNDEEITKEEEIALESESKPRLLVLELSSNQPARGTEYAIKLKEETILHAILDGKSKKYPKLSYKWEINALGSKDREVIAIKPNPEISYKEIGKKINSTGYYNIFCTLMSKNREIKLLNDERIDDFLTLNIEEVPVITEEAPEEPSLTLIDSLTENPKKGSEFFIIDLNSKKSKSNKTLKILPRFTPPVVKLKPYVIAWNIKEKDEEQNHFIDYQSFKSPLQITRLIKSELIKPNKVYTVEAILLDKKKETIKFNEKIISDYINLEVIDSSKPQEAVTEEIDLAKEKLGEEQKEENKFITGIIDLRTNSNKETEVKNGATYWFFSKAKNEFQIISTKNANENKDLKYFWYLKPINEENVEQKEQIPLQFSSESSLKYKKIEDLFYTGSALENKTYNLHCDPSDSKKVLLEKIPIFIKIKLNFKPKEENKLVASGEGEASKTNEETSKESKGSEEETEITEILNPKIEIFDAVSKKSPKSNEEKLIKIDKNPKSKTAKNKLFKLAAKLNKDAIKLEPNIHWFTYENGGIKTIAIKDYKKAITYSEILSLELNAGEEYQINAALIDKEGNNIVNSQNEAAQDYLLINIIDTSKVNKEDLKEEEVKEEQLTELKSEKVKKEPKLRFNLADNSKDLRIRLIESPSNKSPKKTEETLEVSENTRFVVQENIYTQKHIKNTHVRYIWYIAEPDKNPTKPFEATEVPVLSLEEFIDKVHQTGDIDLFVTLESDNKLLTNKKGEPLFDFIKIRIPANFEIEGTPLAKKEGEEGDKEVVRKEEVKNNFDIESLSDKMTKASPQDIENAIIIKEPEKYFILNRLSTKLQANLSRDAAKLENVKYRWDARPVLNSNISGRYTTIALVTTPEMKYEAIKYLVDKNILENKKYYELRVTLLSDDEKEILNSQDKPAQKSITVKLDFTEKPMSIEEQIKKQMQMGSPIVEQAFEESDAGLTLRPINNEVLINPNKRITRVFYNFENEKFLSKGLDPTKEVVMQALIDTNPYTGISIAESSVKKIGELGKFALSIDMQSSPIVFRPNTRYYLTIQLEEQDSGKKIPINVLVLNTSQNLVTHEAIENRKTTETAQIDIRTLQKSKLSEKERKKLLFEKLTSLINEGYPEWATQNKIKSGKLKEYRTFKSYLQYYYSTDKPAAVAIRESENLPSLNDKELEKHFEPILKNTF